MDPLFFFPSSADCNSPDIPERPLDYDFAREELMMNELSNDPIQSAMASLEKQHEEDKQSEFIYRLKVLSIFGYFLFVEALAR